MPERKPTAIRGLKRTPLQTYEYREIPRRQILNAPYNPRTITAVARAKLRQLLERHGLVEALVWNERTSHLVGGHRRLEIVDALEGRDDYSLGVAVIDVSLEREMELNVALNNETLRGDFDPDRFFQLLQGEHAPSLEGMGYTRADLEMEFGPGPQVEALFGGGTEAPDLELVEEDDPADEAEPEPAAAQTSAPEVYLLVAFPTWTVKERFLNALERPGDLRMMAGDEFGTYVKE